MRTPDPRFLPRTGTIARGMRTAPDPSAGVLAVRGARRTLAALLLVATAAFARGAARADEEPPSLPRALFLERTSRDPKAALPVFSALAADPATPAAVRGEARLGEVRCLLALGREADATAVLKRLEQDPDAPLSAKEEARTRLEERARAKAAAEAAQEEARSTETVRRAEQVRLEQEARIAAAARLVDAAEAHVKARRYEEARACLIDALEKNPADDRAATLLEEVGGHADRGELLRQAIRFVASNRVVDYGRLSSLVAALRKAGMKDLRDGKPATAARAFRDAIARIDESDFYADLAEVRRELLMLLERALKTCEEKGIALDEGLSVPAERSPEAAAAAKAWRSDFFALLGRIFASRSDDGAPVRFYDAAIPPDPTPDAKGNRFTSKGIPASVGPGPLRRARWLERRIRDEVAPGGFVGADRLLDRYDDLLIVQHTSGVLRAVDALVSRFPAAPAPVLVDVRVLGAAPGGLADVARLLDAAAAPGESPSAIVTRGRRMSEADLLLSSSDKLVLLAQATVRLVGRHGALLHVAEPTQRSPLYAEGEVPVVEIPDRDATYGLDLDLYAEDLPGREHEAALSVVATVRRPDRARLAPRATKWVRLPTFLTQSLEADRRVPHAGALVLLGLGNPFLATGAAGDPRGGSHPDLVVLVGVRPDAEGEAEPDIPPPAPPRLPDPLSTEPTTREFDLGPLGTEILDEPPPEDWPATPYASGVSAAAARSSRDAFLGGWLGEQAGIRPEVGTVLVRDGRATATLPALEQARLKAQVEALTRDEGRILTLEVRSAEVPTEQALTWLAEAGVRATAEQRLYPLEAGAAAKLAERIPAPAGGTGLFGLDARLAARHTQLVTARAVRARASVSDFRVVRRADGSIATVPVNGTVEEGLVVALRPVAMASALARLYVRATLARVDRTETWRPPGTPGESPPVSLPHHLTEVATGTAGLGERQTLLLLIPVPGTEGARSVIVRVTSLRP